MAKTVEAYMIKKVSDDQLEVVRNHKNTNLKKEQAERYIEAAWYGETPPNLIYITVIGCCHSESKYLTRNICGKIITLEKYE